MGKYLTTHKKNVLFICADNASYSQIAQVLLHNKAGKYFNSYSAGVTPTDINELTLLTLKRLNIADDELTRLKSKSIDELTNTHFDYVINLYHTLDRTRYSKIKAKTWMTWDISTPLPTTQIAKVFSSFEKMAIDLNDRLTTFVTLESPLEHTMKNTRTETYVPPKEFFKCLTDDMRLKTLLLTNYFGELCVCELMMALQENSQPKVSRNLAILKKAGMLVDRKQGQWVFYRPNPNLPLWIKAVINQTGANNLTLLSPHFKRLSDRYNHSNKTSLC